MLEPDADQIDNGPMRREREEEEEEGDNKQPQLDSACLSAAQP
jgi:hypothetical protein